MKKYFAQRIVMTDGHRIISESVSPKRAEVQAEINKYKVDLDSSVFSKTQAEKDELKIEKAHYNLNPEKGKDGILEAFINSKLPNWNLSFIVQ
jgi:hypothetical protein